jgi:hypothetical protein
MLNNKENYKAKKRLTKLISRLFLQNKGLSPQVLLNATIQTQDGHVRFWKGLGGLLFLVLGLYLFLRMDWGVLVAILIIPVGILLVRDAWNGNKKRVRDYLRELADLPDPSGLPDLDLDRLVNKVFSDFGNKFKGGGGEFGGGGASGSWETPIEVDMLSNADIPITLDLPDVSDISTDIPLGDLPDVSEGASEIAGSILEGVFSSLDVGL